MGATVVLTSQAWQDLSEIIDYVAIKKQLLYTYSAGRVGHARPETRSED